MDSNTTVLIDVCSYADNNLQQISNSLYECSYITLHTSHGSECQASIGLRVILSVDEWVIEKVSIWRDWGKTSLTLWWICGRAQSFSCRCLWDAPLSPQWQKASPLELQWTGDCRLSLHHQKSWSEATQDISKSNSGSPICPSGNELKRWV